MGTNKLLLTTTRLDDDDDFLAVSRRKSYRPMAPKFFSKLLSCQDVMMLNWAVY